MSSALDELYASFRDRLAERVGEIEAAWEAGELRSLHRLAHSLYGAAGTFGYTAAAEAARALERRALEILNRPGESDIAALAPWVAALRGSL